ncbi:PQQ-binding-like beta-propeller repeat protein [Candidatus Bathyarchaeota archaeon A05DMB-2]|jgi:outer membrane protein assembly factor BamB|nr:PQQ-binding-like beta-propeller repeat protein [Candidatus Bathyarchaeota archaeon A05DMB-2]
MQLPNKTRNTVIALLLISTFAISLVAIPAVNAHDPAWKITTYAYINVAPNPVGVGQKVDILIWLDKTYGSNPMLTNNYRFHNYNLTIVKSDGTKVLEKIFDVVVDTTSSQYYAWTPEEVGTYTLYFTFPGQDYNTGVAGEYDPNSVYVNDTFLPSSASTTLTVQEEQLPSPITSYPLPAEYWTRPIYGENTDWWSISSNWLGTGSPGISSYSSSGSYYARAPDGAVGSQTAHIMWTKSLQSGGVVGGTTNTAVLGDTWFEGSAYNQRYTNPIIVDGMLIYNPPVSFTGTSSGPTTCVDLRTGEVIWSRSDVPAISFAYVYDVQDPQQHGVYPAVLFTSNFAQAYDAYTGDPLFNVTGVPTGTAVLGPQGEHLRYVFANIGTTTSPNWTLGQWNSSKLWKGLGFADPTTYQLSPTPDTTTTTTWSLVNTTTWVNGVETVITQNVTKTTTAVDASISTGPHTRYDWNVTLPDLNTMTTAPTVIAAIYGDMLICYNGSLPILDVRSGKSSSAPYTYFAINLNASKGAIGRVLWWNTVNAPSGNITVATGGVDPVNRVFYEIYKETTQFVGYSMDTGAKLWTTDGQGALDYYGNPAFPYIASTVAYGKLYSIAYGGILYCYDTATGDLLWTYGNGGVPGNDTSSGFYLAYGHYPAFIGAIGNGIVYTFTAEHTVNTPIYKGAKTRAINATDGTEIWTLSAYTGSFFAISYAIADGFNTFFNGYDNRIYVVGRGPSATTVSAPDTAVAFGTPVVIKGTVMDISAGTQQDEQAARFPNGVPCASDESMSDWMEYVYQQKPKPTNFTGVPVTISVLDSNNNYRTIGTTTTDASGTFWLTWTPDIPGNFTVYANFAGTNGYWPSHAESAFTVMAEPEATPEPTPTPASMADLYFMPMSIGLIVAIVAVGAVIILMLRKRP